MEGENDSLTSQSLPSRPINLTSKLESQAAFYINFGPKIFSQDTFYINFGTKILVKSLSTLILDQNF